MKKNLLRTLIFLVLFSTLFYFSYQYISYYIAESLVIEVKYNDDSKIKNIREMFSIDEDIIITKMIYSSGFPEGFNLEILIYNRQDKKEQSLFYSGASNYSTEKTYLEYYFKCEGKEPIEKNIYKVLLIINFICIIILIIYWIRKIKKF